MAENKIDVPKDNFEKYPPLNIKEFNLNNFWEIENIFKSVHYKQVSVENENFCRPGDLTYWFVKFPIFTKIFYLSLLELEAVKYINSLFRDDIHYLEATFTIER